MYSIFQSCTRCIVSYKAAHMYSILQSCTRYIVSYSLISFYSLSLSLFFIISEREIAYLDFLHGCSWVNYGIPQKACHENYITISPKIKKNKTVQ